MQNISILVLLFASKVNGQNHDLIVDCSLSDNAAYANPLDCSAFIYCIWGEAKHLNCPKGLHFNPDTKICDWPKYGTAKCAQRPLIVQNGLGNRRRRVIKSTTTTTEIPQLFSPYPEIQQQQQQQQNQHFTQNQHFQQHQPLYQWQLLEYKKQQEKQQVPIRAEQILPQPQPQPQQVYPGLGC